MEYATGYNSALGDGGSLFKMSVKRRNTLPKTERK